MATFGRTTPPTILIVEDEAIVRLELVDRFEDLGMVALAAANADEAIVLLDARPEIELMLTDIKMPGSMDGVRLAHHVRDRWPPVKIIVLSGMLGTTPAQLPRGSTFVGKPYDPDALEQAMARVLGGVPLAPGPRLSRRA